MDKYCIDDRVRFDSPYSHHHNMTGTVLEVNDDFIVIQWDKFMGGHSLHGKCEKGYGWNYGIEDSRIKLCEKEPDFEDTEAMSEFLKEI